MGLFDNDYTVHVEVKAQSLIEPKYQQDFKKNAITEAILDDKDITDTIIGFGAKGIQAKAYSYALKAEQTPHLITGYIGSTFVYIREQDIKNAIEHERNHSDIEIVSSFTMGYRPYYEAVMYLARNHEYDTESKTIGDPPEGSFGVIQNNVTFHIQSAYLDNGDLVIEYYRREENNEPNPDGSPMDPIITNYTYRVPGYVNPPETDLFTYVEYTLGSDVEPKQHYFWYYNVTTGSNPFVNAGAIQDIHDMYTPFLFLRKYYTNLIDVITEEEERKLNIALSPLGVDLETLHSGVLSTDNGNDPSSFEDVFFSLAPSIIDKSDAAIKYHIALFKKWETLQTVNKAKYQAYITDLENGNYSDYLNGTFFYSAVYDMNQRVYYNYIETVVEPLSPYLSAHPDAQYQVVTHTLEPLDESVYYGGSKHTLEQSYVSYNRRVSDSEMECVKVHGLVMFHRVWDGDRNREIKGNRGLVLNLQETKIREKAEGLSDFRIPLNIEVMRQALPMFEQADLVQKSMQISVYAAEVQEIKWYEKNAFRIVLQVIIIVVSIIFQQYQNIGWALALEVAAQIIFNIVLAQILSWGFQVLFEMIGIENTFIATVIIITAAIYAGSFEIGSFSIDAMTIVDATIQAGERFVQEEMQDLQEGYLEALNAYEKELDALAELEYEMNYNPLLDVVTNSVLSMDTFRETPEMFLARTLNTEPGKAALDYIENFSKIMLQLPLNYQPDVLSDATGNL